MEWNRKVSHYFLQKTNHKHLFRQMLFFALSCFPLLLAARSPLVDIPPPELTPLEDKIQQRLIEAQSEFAAFLKKPKLTDKELGDAYGELGKLYHAHHLYDSAEACYRNAETLLPNDFQWAYLLAYVYQTEYSQFDKAAANYQRALELRPNYGQTRLRLAQVYLDLDQPDKAEPLLQEVLKNEELKGGAALWLGKAAFKRKDFPQAITWFEKALAQHPEATRIHYPLAMAYRAIGEVDKARQHLEKHSEGQPAIPDPVLEEMQAFSSGARIYLYRAMKAVWAKQFDVAAKEFAQAVALEPHNAEHRVSLARALYMIGDKSAAEKQLSEALALDTKQAQAHYFLGRIQEESGQIDSAVKHYQAAIENDPKHGGAHLLLGSYLMRAGQYEEAARHYAQAVEIQPQDVTGWQLESFALIATPAHHPDAKKRLQKGIAIHPDNPDLNRALARLLAASPAAEVRDGAAALKLAEKLFQQVNSIENAETVAMAYAELNNYEQALVYQQAAIDAALQLGGLELLPFLEENANHYRAKQACRTPWPANAPVFYPIHYGK